MSMLALVQLLGKVLLLPQSGRATLALSQNFSTLAQTLT
jgi:hypothetical protein